MKNVLVTGGAGFLGSNFVKKSIGDRADIEITVLDSLTYAGNLENLSLVSDRIRFIQGDIRDKRAVWEAMNGQDLVVHFAAESHNDNSLKNPGIFVDTNVVGTSNLIQAAVSLGVRFHHISTDEVYGDLELDSNERFHEGSPYNPSSPYSASKAASDLMVRAWVRSFGLQATISNCSNNYGPNQHAEKLIPTIIRHLAKGMRPPIYGDGTNVRDWIHVDDHTEGIWAVVNKGRIGETYLLGANNERSNKEVLAAILREFGQADDFFEFVEDRPGHDVRYAIDSSKAKSELGWEAQFTDFEENIRDLVELYRA
jgi:dTDP-glucose 4,6-dehydratase